MTNKICTSIEQSKKLIELGIDRTTADMYWSHVVADTMVIYEPMVITLMPHENESIPTWSLDALLNYIKDRCGYFELVYLSNTSDGRGNKLENVYRLSTDLHDVYAKEILDAAYEMVCLLKENNKL